MSDAELQQAGMSREQAESWIGAIEDARTATIVRSRDARSQKLEGANHNAFMTDVLFSDLPAEQRIAQAGDVDPAAAFVQISAWAGDFMAEHVRDAK